MDNPILTPPSHHAGGVHAEPRKFSIQRLMGHPHFRLWLLAFLGLITLVLVLILLGEVNMANPKTVEIGPSQAGNVVELKTGDHLQVSLDGNLTTGYTWEVASLDPAILKLGGDPEFKADSTALGAGGKIILRFDTVGTGTSPLKLIYHRTFEKNVGPLQTFEVSVTVRK